MKRLSDDPAVRLAESRGYSANAAIASSTADRFVACQAPTFDEAAERDKAYEAWDGNGEWVDFRDGWLSCAKSRAEVK